MHDSDETSRPKAAHQIGERLDDCSVAELEARILLLRQEIERLEAAKAQKEAARHSAGAFFKS